MDDNTPGFLNDELLNQPDTPATAAPQGAPVPASEPPPNAAAQAPAQGEATPAATATAVQPMTAPATPASSEPHHVPLVALLDTREKLKELQTERDQLRSQLEELQRQNQPPQKPQLPDQFTDPEGFAQAVLAQAEQAALSRIIGNSLDAAEERYGDTFRQAFAAVEKNPDVVRQVLASRDPGEAIVKWYQRQQIVTAIPEDITDLDEWVKQRYAAMTAQAAQPTSGVPGAQGAAPVAPHIQQPAAPAAPPPSLASAPGSANAFQDQVPDSAFAYAFGR